jgi:hypothetical protein
LRVSGSKIKCSIHFNLVQKLFNIGVFSELKSTHKKLAQKFILYPIICNIYLHKLDIEINNIQKKYETNNKKYLSTKYTKKIKLINTKKFLHPSLQNRIIVAMRKNQNTYSSKITHIYKQNLNNRKIRYIRYLNILLFGTAESKEIIEAVNKKITNYIKSNLKLRIIKKKMIHIAANKINFLGMFLFKNNNSKIFQKQRTKSGLLLSRRSIINIKLQKVTNAVFKKTLKKSKNFNLNTVLNLKKKIQKIQQEILTNEKFSRTKIRIYREFLIFLTQSKLFIPLSLKKILFKLEKEIQQ